MKSLRIGAVAAVVAALLVPLAAAPVAAAPGFLEGTVFRDQNFDGELNSLEIGEPGIVVTVTDSLGVTLVDTSDDDGAWSVAVGALTGPFRVEFSIPPALDWLAPGPMGVDNRGSVDFAVDGDEDIDFGVVNPAHYCEDNPDVATNCYVLYDQVAGPNSAEPVLVGTEYLASGDGAGGTGTPEFGIADAADIGTTWGLGYQTFNDTDDTNDLLYASSFMKRFSGYGPSGTNAIYVLDDAGAIVDTFAVGTADVDPHDFTPVGDGGAPEEFEIVDAASYGAVGRQSFGDLDLSEDDTRLYVMHVGDDRLYELDIESPGGGTYGDTLRSWDVTGVDLGLATCGAGLLRPFATGVNDGLVYIGSVCEGPTTDDLVAFVHEMDPDTATGVPGDFRLVMSVDLDYTREEVANNFGLTAEWEPWDDTFQANGTGFGGEFAYPQPWVTDIEFDNGDLIVGIRDRYGDQTGNLAASTDWPTDTALYTTDGAGDMIRACGIRTAGVRTFIAENDSSGDCDTANGAALSGPNGGREWYADDFYTASFGIGHEEIASGGLAQIGSSNSVLATGYDTLDDDVPAGIDGSFSAGLMRMNNLTGVRTGSYRVIGQGIADRSPFGKATGLGDVEAKCGAAPLEIGNFVWFDADRDGVADPGEAPLQDVVVNLYADTNGDGDPDGPVIGSVTTSATGHYVFTDGVVTGGLQPLTDYVVEFDITTNGVTGPGGEALELTTANATGDLLDSDPSDIGGGLSQVAVTTGVPGTFDHSFDAGYTPMPRIGNLVWIDGDNDGSVDAGEAPVVGVTVEIYADDGDGSLDADDILAGPIGSTTTDGDGNWWFEVPEGGTYYVAVPDGQAPLDGHTSSTGAGSNIVSNTTDNNDDGDPASLGGADFASISGPILATSLGALPTGEEDANTGTAGGGGAETYVNTESGVIRADVDSNLTIDLGFVPPYEIGNLVWFDDDNDGVRDAGEDPVPGVTVTLLDDGGVVIATEITDADGHYEFDGLLPGDYSVEIPASQFDAGGTLEGYHPSTGAGVSTDPDDDTDDNSDGAADAGAVRSGVLTLGPGEPTDEVDESPNGVADDNSNLTVDFGFYRMALGDQLWFDEDNDGVFDPGEEPVAGVVVELLDGDGDVIATTTSDSDGIYGFDGLPEGDYVVRIPTSQFDDGAVLDGFGSSTGNDDADGNAPDPDDDVEDDDNGTPDETGAIVSAPVTLDAGTEPDGGNTNLSVDFGFIKLGSISGTVWDDDGEDGVNDPGEDPLEGVTVNLIDPDTNAVIETTETDADGDYIFDDLYPGDYIVEIEPPNGTELTIGNVGDDTTDSDVDPTTNRTGVITVEPCEFITDVDGGILVPPELAITGLLGGPVQIAFFASLAILLGALFVRRRDTLAAMLQA
ncbi:MAG: SdrD B-like domain-containing protein [Actinomycetota bacterium]